MSVLDLSAVTAASSVQSPPAQVQAPPPDSLGDSGKSSYPTPAQEAEATYLELSGVASATRVEPVNVSEPPNLAAAASLMAQIAGNVHEGPMTGARAFQMLSAATTLTMTAN